MKESYILKIEIQDNKTELYKWVKTERYDNTDYVLITQNNIPMEILIPFNFYDAGGEKYKQLKLSLYKKKWNKEWCSNE